MTKIADKLAKATDNMRRAILSRFKKHNEKIGQIANKPINKQTDGWTKTAKITEKIGGVGAHVVADTVDLSAAMVLILSKWFIKLSDMTLFDNRVIDFMNEKFSKQTVKKNKYGKDKKLSKFTKENPRVSAYLSWYLMLLTAIGGISIAKHKDKTSDESKDKIENVKGNDNLADNDIQKSESGTYGDYFDKLHKITPLLIADLISKEGVHVNEDGLHIPYIDSKGIWTIGFGSTVLKNGTRVTKNTQPISTEEAYELARWHLEDGETYFGMYCYDTAFGAVDINDIGEAFALGSIMYNSFSKLIENPENENCKERFAQLRQVYKKEGRKLTAETVKEWFQKYPVTDPRSFGEAWLSGQSKQNVANKLGNFLVGGRGLYWRRWLEAGLLTGDITPQMLLDCPVNGIPEFFNCMQKKKDAFFIKNRKGEPVVNKKTYDKFKEWLKRPVDSQGHELRGWKKIRDYIPEYALKSDNIKSQDLLNKNKSKTIALHDAEKIVNTKTKSIDMMHLVQNETNRA